MRPPSKKRIVGFLIFLMHCEVCEGDLEKDNVSSLHFTQNIYNATIYENSAPKTYAESHLKMGVYMADPHWVVKYRITSGDTMGFFKTEEQVVGNFCFLRIRTRSGNTALLNREVKDIYVLTIQASEKIFNYEAFTKVIIHILDRNDLKPLFSPPSYRLSVKENTSLKTTIGKVSATDADLGQNAMFYYTFNPRNTLFSVHPTSGAVTLTGTLNATQRNNYELQVLAVDRMKKISEDNRFGDLASFVVQVESALKKPPSITEVQVTTCNLPENLLCATLVVDASEMEVQSLDIKSGDSNNFFKIVKSYAGSNEFMVVATKEINWLDNPFGFNLSLQAKDKGNPPLHSQIKTIYIPPSRYVSARFQQDIYRVLLSECAPPGSQVTMVKVNAGFPNLKYFLKPTPDSTIFKINPHTGLITTSKLIQNQFHFELEVTATTTQASATVYVDIIDCNNHAPSFRQSSYHGTFNENIPVGTSVFQVSATDADRGENGLLTYTLSNQRSVPFAIDTFSGIISTSKSLDYEMTRRLYSLHVWASDCGSPFRRETEVYVSLTLNNLNDNVPMFEKVNCNISIPRDLPIGENIIFMSAVDLDELHHVKYEISSGNELQKFDLDPISGMISLKESFQYHSNILPSFYSLKIIATDGEYYSLPTTVNITTTSPGLPVSIQCEETGVLKKLKDTIIDSVLTQSEDKYQEEDVSVNIHLINSHAPKFDNSFPVSIDVMEDITINSTIVHLVATDPDTGFNGKLVYVISDKNEDSCFTIDPETGLLKVFSPLDREKTSFYILNITVYDLGTPQKSSWKLLAVNILDANDNTPRFPSLGYQVTIPEDANIGSAIIQVKAEDADIEDNRRIKYSIITSTDKFAIDETTGQITVTGVLDREIWPQYILKIEARDQPKVGQQLFSITDLIVVLEDINDNTPHCIPALGKVKAPEDLPLGTILFFVEAIDADSGPRGEITYTLNSDEQGIFSMEKITGALTLERELDFEKTSFYNLTVKASDGGQPLSQSSVCYVEVDVLDVNENLHPPQFPSFVFRGWVQENLPIGTSVITMTAQDHDKGKDGEIVYSIRDGTSLTAFSIEEDTGLIRTTAPLDHEGTSHYWLTVQATDLGSQPLSSIAEVYIEVTDINDNTPQLSQPAFYASVTENSPQNVFVLQLEAWDADTSANGKLTFQITTGNTQGFFTINPDTGVISTTTQQLDREYKAEHILEVAVSDNGYPTLQSSSRAIISVLDVNDNAPAFLQKLFLVSLPEQSDSTDLRPIYRLVALDRDEGQNSQVTYSTEDDPEDLFIIHPTTGVVSSRNTFPAGEYHIPTIRATDGGSPSLSSSVRLHIKWIPKPAPSSEPLTLDEPYFNFEVMETDPVNHMVGFISTESSSSHLWFDITSGDDDLDFDVDKSTGGMVIARALNASKRSNYNLTVQVTDGSSILRTQAYIHVINVNQHRPQFLEKHYEVTIPEDATPGTEVVQVSATDQDSGNRLIYTVQSSFDPRSMNLFHMDPNRGILSILETLDYESMPFHTFTVMVRDQEVPIKRSFVRVIIHVEDRNDNPPRFGSWQYTGDILSSAAIGSEVLQVKAFDKDHGTNADIFYSISAGNGEDFFSIDPLSGIITLAKKLDHIKQEYYALTVSATNQPSPQLSDSTTAHIKVKLSESESPKFSAVEYFAEVSESSSIGSFVILVSARSSSALIYEIREGNQDGAFAINSFSGLISTLKNLDFEKVSSYRLKVRATNMLGMLTDVTVFIYLIDENDNAPTFLKSAYVGYINESSRKKGMVVNENHAPLVVQATDADKDSNALLVYEILEPEILKYFKMDSSMGTLTTTAELDYELTPVFHFSVHVHDSGTPSLFASKPASVTIYVKDVNDSPPVFLQNTYEVTIWLPSQSMTILTVQAKDPDSSEVTYSIVEGNLEGVFSIHPSTGLISLINATLLRAYHELIVRATDGLYKSTALVKINVMEVQETMLRFDQTLYTAKVTENTTVIKNVIVLGVLGYQLNEPLFYSILNDEEMFRMISSSGVLQTTGVEFDREEKDLYEIAVQVKDNRNPPRVAQSKVKIYVEDINDNPPVFESLPYYASVQEDAEPGDVMFQVSATDRDIGNYAAITFSFAEDYTYFWIDSRLGDISIKKTLDHETLNKYFLKVIAQDGGVPPLSTEEQVLITLRNKSSPIFQSLYYVIKVPENIPVYTSILHIQAHSPHGLRVIYNLVEEESLKMFNIDFKTGVLSVVGQLDYESKITHTLTVRATDTALGSFSDAVIEVRVDDINDNSPVFSQLVYTAVVLEGLPAHTAVVQVFVTDEDSGRNKMISYSILDKGSEGSSKCFHIDSSTGEISTAQELDYEKRNQFHIKLRAVDNGIPPLASEALVIVNVSDINDNPPEFRQSQYEASVNELASCGYVVIKVQALDSDSADITKLNYLILSGNNNRHFNINTTSGIISVSRLCRNNLSPSYNLRVSVSDGVYKTDVPVYINTTYTNKYSPNFQQHMFEVELAENAERGTKVIHVLAFDPDDGPYGMIDYTIINKLAYETFSINDAGHIATLKKLDRENSTERVIEIKVMARDGGGKVAFCTVKIILTDENDNPPQFTASEYTVSVHSNISKGSPIIQPLAYDADEGINADVSYSVDNIPEQLIEISPSTGIVRVKESLAGLENKVFTFKVKAQDSGPPFWNSSIPVHFQVVPTEVSLPKFSEPLYTFSISEDLPAGSEVGLVTAVAEEPVTYSVVEGTTAESNKDGVFTLDKQTGVLKVAKTIDHERTKWYQIGALAKCSHSDTELVSLGSVSIQVKDVNDNWPVFEANPYKAFLVENMPAGTTVIQVTANDQDTGSDGHVTYSLETKPALHGLFAVDKENGWITTLKELDCETAETYRFKVMATDHGKKVQLTSQTLVEVTIIDENDNPPRFTSDLYKGSVIENSHPGEFIVTLRTTDADSSEQNRRATCSITEGDPLGQFSINQIGEEWIISSQKSLDREEIEKYHLKVMASDGKFQTAADVEIVVLDVNDNSPQCQQMQNIGKIPEDALPGLFILSVSAQDPDAGRGAQITYTLHGPGAREFRLDPHTGELTTFAPLDREQKAVYQLVAKATDGGGRSCQADVTLTVEDVNDNAPRFSTAHYVVAVFHNTKMKTPIAVVFAKDPDEGYNAEVRYILRNSANGQFSIEEATGVIYLEKSLQEAKQSTIEITVGATDQGTPHQLSNVATVTVSVVDLSDYLPVFWGTEYVVAVMEDKAVGTEVLNLTELTRQSAENVEIKYKIVNGNEHGKFLLNARTGILYVNGSLDCDVCHEYYLSIEGSRGSAASLSDVIMVVINITDVNDHEPRFAQEHYVIEVSEDVAVGDVILTISADDKDGPMNNQITYTLIEGDPNGHFSIHPKLGEIRVVKHLDREEISHYSLKVRAEDNGYPVLFSDGEVDVQVLDVNDNPPTFFQLNNSLVVQEGNPVGTSILELVLTDRDSPENGPPYLFRITSGNNEKAFQVDQNGLLVTSSVLNRKAKDHYLLQVQVSDSGIPPLSSFAFVNIQVIERSQYPPSALPLEIFISTNERVFQGGVLGKIHATDRDPHDTLLYNLISEQPEEAHFSVGNLDGKILASKGLPCGDYALNLSISDQTFTTFTSVQVHVWCFSQGLLERSLVLRFSQISPEEFIGDHWRSLQRFLGNILNTNRQQIHMGSLQRVEASSSMDLLLVVGDSDGPVHKPHLIADKISASAHELEQSVGLQLKKIIYLPCHGTNCAKRICKENVQLDPDVLFTYSTARLSVITPQHALEQTCSCNGTAVKFDGHSFMRYHKESAKDWVVGFLLRTHQSHAVLVSINGTTPGLLELVNGVLHFKSRCHGNSHWNYSSQHFLNDGAWHEVLLGLKQSSFRLLVDGLGETVQLSVPCKHSHPKEEMVIGGLIHQRQKILQAFRGCLDAISINGEDVSQLRETKAGKILEEVGIKQCCSPGGACNGDPCHHGGFCVELHSGDYTCMCPPSFIGHHCEFWDGPCESQPCFHGGTCSTTSTGYTCSCLLQYQGERCEKEATGCLQQPCLNAGHCVKTGPDSSYCNCTDGYKGHFCDVVTASENKISNIISGPQEIVEILIGVFVILIVAAVVVVLLRKRICRRIKTHKPVAKEDLDAVAKNELSKNIGVDTQTAAPPIELDILSKRSQNDLDTAGQYRHPDTPELITFGSGKDHKHRVMAVCSVAPNLPPAPPSSSDNESIVKSTWEGEDYVYPRETAYWSSSYHPAAMQDYPHYEIIQNPPLPPPDLPPPIPPPPRDSEHVTLYGGFPFPLDQGNKRAPIPPRYSNQSLEDMISSSPLEPPASRCQNEYTAISYYPSEFMESQGTRYLPDASYKRVNMRLSVAQPSFADCKMVPSAFRVRPPPPPNYEDSDLVESDYGSSEEVVI
uniref:Protocadherin Fat 2 n=1 Tax=Geotrypetes seraphini TaxID=260995 RepID=A0A6P8PHT0_GEOSA|nr:protocadherin Fat 2 [Geotrypetes seraphini]XP_033783425.1 protocadherin Fat 2 [Geotrypetes seraphini]XP_033783426.1 protocadherin Fat 2 [Geotrypetes seraphini]